MTCHRIERIFHFRNFQKALGFVRKVGDLAETEGHHPDISFGCLQEYRGGASYDRSILKHVELSWGWLE